MALEEFDEILKYSTKKGRDFRKKLKATLFEKIADGKLIQYYLERTMKEIPDKEIFVELSALNYEKRTTHTHLAFCTKKNSFHFAKEDMVFDKAMSFEIEKIRLIRKLMEISGEKFGLVLQEENGKYYIKGAAPLTRLKDMYQVEIVGHSTWKLKYSQEELFEYKEGIYKLPCMGSQANLYGEEYKKITQIISDKGKCKTIMSAIDEIRKNATHGTGIVFIENDTVLKNEINRLEKFDKAYPLKKKHAINLSNATSEILRGITSIDGAIFCNFDLECKAIGVIVDGVTVQKGDSGRGARYNSLTNYVNWLNSKTRKANVNCMAVIISEDGPLNIEISKPDVVIEV